MAAPAVVILKNERRLYVDTAHKTVVLLFFVFGKDFVFGEIADQVKRYPEGYDILEKEPTCYTARGVVRHLFDGHSEFSLLRLFVPSSRLNGIRYISTRAPGKTLAPTLVELCNYLTLCYVVTGKRFAQTKYGFLKRFFQLKALRKIFLARNKRDLVAATEMPASSATSFTERSSDW
jgi:hypothetical protein